MTTGNKKQMSIVLHVLHVLLFVMTELSYIYSLERVCHTIGAPFVRVVGYRYI